MNLKQLLKRKISELRTCTIWIRRDLQLGLFRGHMSGTLILAYSKNRTILIVADRLLIAIGDYERL